MKSATTAHLHLEELISDIFCRCPLSSPVEAAPMSLAQNLNILDYIYDKYKFTMTTAANQSSPTLKIPEKLDEYSGMDHWHQQCQIVNEFLTAHRDDKRDYPTIIHGDIKPDNIFLDGNMVYTDEYHGFDDLHQYFQDIYEIWYIDGKLDSTIIHRDIKTSNILLNGNMAPKISDFGISKVLMEEERTWTKESYIGTQGYIAPEFICRFTQIMKIIIEIDLIIPFVHDILVLLNSGASLSAAVDVDKIKLLLDSDGKALAATPSMHQRHFFRSNLADERSDKPRSNGAPTTNSSQETTHAPMANKLTDNEEENHSDPNSCMAERDTIEKEKRSAEWYIATGAAHHATWKRDLLSNLVDVENDGLYVHAADGTPMPVCGRGDVVTDDVVLPDVYYVPALCTNLVSVGQLAGLDYCIGFGRGACIISNAAGAVVGRAHARGDGLYEVDFLRVPVSMP